MIQLASGLPICLKICNFQGLPFERFDDLEIESDLADGPEPWIKKGQTTTTRATQQSSERTRQGDGLRNNLCSIGRKDVEIDGEGIQIVNLKGYESSIFLEGKQNVLGN